MYLLAKSELLRDCILYFRKTVIGCNNYIDSEANLLTLDQFLKLSHKVTTSKLEQLVL